MSMHLSDRDMFGSRKMPRFKRAQLVDMPVPNSDRMKVFQTQSLTQ